MQTSSIQLCRAMKHLAKAGQILVFLPNLGRTVSHSALIGCTSFSLHITTQQTSGPPWDEACGWGTFMVCCRTCAIIREISQLMVTFGRKNQSTSTSRAGFSPVTFNLIVLCQQMLFEKPLVSYKYFSCSLLSDSCLKLPKAYAGNQLYAY